jgi:phosphoribosylformimino-5-aminoimidazole carboxamide ribotide isomerase
VLVIPAVDIKDGRCVRLYQGEMDKETVYFQKPVEAARHWANEGATLLHVVDLDGAVMGRPVHRDELAAICAVPGLRVEIGGGLRSLEAIDEAIALGVERVVIGTAAHADPDFLRSVCRKYPARVVVGIDAREGRAAIKGWKETTSVEAVKLATDSEALGAARIIYTDISRDGTGLGVNIDDTLKVARAVEIPVIASGGVTSLDDIRRLREIEKEGVEGVIIGRALYSGAFTLREAIGISAGRIG